MPALLALHSLALPFRTFRTSEISAEHPSPKLLLELVLLAALPQPFHVFPLFFADAGTLRCLVAHVCAGTSGGSVKLPNV